MKEIKDINWAWIEENMSSDSLSLSLRNTGKIDRSEEIMQIDCRKRCLSKLDETLKNKKFYFPTYLSAQQCTSDKLADFHTSLIDEGATVLDMTCGLGIDSFHMAKKASNILAIDINQDIIKAARYNAEVLQLENMSFQTAECVKWISENPDKYDVIFIDPARRDANGKRLFALEECSPDILSIYPLLKSRCKRLIIKMSPMLDIKSIISKLPEINHLYAIGTDKECKELIAVIDFDNDSPMILHSVSLLSSRSYIMNYYTYETAYTNYEFAEPAQGDFLYRPYPSLMKINYFDKLTDMYDILPISRNTHLFVSHHRVEEFPGEEFSVVEVLPFNKQSIKNFHKKYPKINIATRNFILKPSQLADKLKVKEGGNQQLFGVSYPDGSNHLIIAERTSR